MVKSEFLAGSWIGTGVTFLTMHTQEMFLFGFFLTLFVNLVALWDRFKPAFLSIGKRLALAWRWFLALWR